MLTAEFWQNSYCLLLTRNMNEEAKQRASLPNSTECPAWNNDGHGHGHGQTWISFLHQLLHQRGNIPSLKHVSAEVRTRKWASLGEEKVIHQLQLLVRETPVVDLLGIKEVTPWNRKPGDVALLFALSDKSRSWHRLGVPSLLVIELALSGESFWQTVPESPPGGRGSISTIYRLGRLRL